jgi:mRNA interferase RelE/StbE
MPFAVRFKSSARREYDKLDDSLKSKIRPVIDELEQEPRPHGAIKLTHSGNEYRIRVGTQRIVYTIEESIKIVEIQRIRDRRDVYRKR